jgi:excisionase family DNA binding protein
MKLLTVSDVAAMLQVSRRQVYRLVEDAGLPVLRVGPKSLRVDPEALAGWLSDRKVDAR